MTPVLVAKPFNGEGTCLSPGERRRGNMFNAQLDKPLFTVALIANHLLVGKCMTLTPQLMCADKAHNFYLQLVVRNCALVFIIDCT